LAEKFALTVRVIHTLPLDVQQRQERTNVPDNGPLLRESNSTAMSLLTQPELFLPILAEAMQDELAFYTLDQSGRFTFLSKSAEHVFCRDRDWLLNRNVGDLLTDNPCNEPLRMRTWQPYQPHSARTNVCEIYDRDGNRVALKYCQVSIWKDGVCIGSTGVIGRLAETSEASPALLGTDDVSLMHRVGLLTDVERQVVELVVDGHMNKNMAMILDVAVRTIESRRSRAMIKLQARSLSELVRSWIRVRQIEARMRVSEMCNAAYVPDARRAYADGGQSHDSSHSYPSW
jgi:DNA-binding CsgD family transcriptional regulator